MANLDRPLTPDELSGVKNLVELKLKRKNLRRDLKARISKKGIGPIEAGIRNFAEGALGNFSEELARGAVALSQTFSDTVDDAERDIGRAFVPDKAFKKLGEKSPLTQFLRDEFRELQKDRAAADVGVGLEVSQEQQPGVSTFSRLGGSIANQLAISAIAPQAKAAQAASLLFGGGLQSAGAAEGGLANRAIAAFTGAGAAGIGGTVAVGGGAIAKSIFNPLLRRFGIGSKAVKSGALNQVDDFIDEAIGSNFTTTTGSEGARFMGGVARSLPDDIQRAANGEFKAAGEKVANDVVFKVTQLLQNKVKTGEGMLRHTATIDKVVKDGQIALRALVEKSKGTSSLKDLLTSGAKITAASLSKNPIAAASAAQGSAPILRELVKQVPKVLQSANKVKSSFNPGGVIQQSLGILPAAAISPAIGEALR